MSEFFTRLGDGAAVMMSKEDIRYDVEDGTADAADRGQIPELAKEEVDYLVEILTMPQKNVSVERGHEGIMTFDAGTLKLPVRAGIPVDRLATLMIHERILCSDTMELCTTDYSYKSIKNFVQEEAMTMELAQNNCVMPIFYGAMPNLGQYTKPDGPIDNWSELLPMGKIAEAREAQEEAVEHAVSDMVFITGQMAEAGACGIQFDTVGASGDADVLAALMAAKELKKRFPNIGIEMGMAGEFNLGMHGQLEFEGERIAGAYPHQQVKMAEKAGVDIFGCVVNTNSNQTFAWNLARALTYAKACVAAAEIPVVVDAGMGVGGVTNTNTTPTDVTSRVSKALLEIAKVDGLQIGHGDAYGMAAVHELSSGMGGIRTAGDLVSRMVMKGMRLSAAKEFVADKLHCSVLDLSDTFAMKEIRESLDIGTVLDRKGASNGMEAKFNIEKVLGIEIPSVTQFKKKTGLL